MFLVFLGLWLAPAITLVFPTYRYMSSNNDHWHEDFYAFATSVGLSAGWPFWAFMLIRKAYLQRLIGGRE